MRLARFNIQTATATDKRYFAGLPSPAAGGVIASTVFMYPWGLQDPRARGRSRCRWCSCPALLMVSTIRFRSIKAIDVGWRRSYIALFIGAVLHRADRLPSAARAGRHAYTYIIWVGRELRRSRRLRRRPACRRLPIGAGSTRTRRGGCDASRCQSRRQA